MFPNTLAVGSAAPDYRMYAFQIRVPMDDTHTLHYWYTAFVPPAGAVVPPELLAEVPFYHVPCVDEEGEYRLDMIDAQEANGHVPPIVPTDGWGRSKPDGSASTSASWLTRPTAATSRSSGSRSARKASARGHRRSSTVTST